MSLSYFLVIIILVSAPCFCCGVADYWDGDWTIYVKYDVDVCVQTQDYVLNDSIGQTVTI